MLCVSESLAVSMSLLPAEQRRAILSELSDDEAVALLYDWRFWARSSQLAPPGNWRIWLLLAGRGFGKTRTGAEWVRENVESGRYRRLALIAPTSADARDVMVEGESGMLAISPPGFRPLYEPSKRRLTWPNGAIATMYSADEPDRLRGPQHDGAWADELAAWRYPEAWDMLMFGLRLGADPRCVVTTTPRPTPIIKSLVAASTTVTTRGSTYENIDNLAPAFAEQIISRYEGTRIGRQELHAEILTDVEGALWQWEWIDGSRVAVAPQCTRVVVAVDPAGTHSAQSDETGIVVAGLGEDGGYYVLHGLGYRLSPQGWATRTLNLYDEHAADRIVAERNQGGEMVEHTIRMVRDSAPVKTIVASRGKALRAEPVAALYEQGKVHHVGVHSQLEDQMCAFPVAAEHDDMVDALVYAITELMAPAGRVQVTSNPFY